MTNYTYQGNTCYATDGLISNRLPFHPLQHGFHFTNNYVFKPTLGGIGFGGWKMGLCGGMCAGALYRYKNHIAVPTDTNPPVDGSNLFEELYKRQKRSLSISLIARIYDWQSAPDSFRWNRKYSIGYRTKKEWPKLKNLLDVGSPTIIVLIRTKGYYQNLTKNHQALAIGYDFHSNNRILVIHTYDPNIPNMINHLTLNFGLPENNLNASDSSGECLRGFLVNSCGDKAAA